MASTLPVYDDGLVRAQATSQLKSSGQAIVYKGTMAGIDGLVAMKVFEKKTTWGNEVMLLLRIPHHDHVMDLLRVFSKDVNNVPRPCLVTRFIAAGDLRDCLDNHHSQFRCGFVGDTAVRLLRGIGEGIQHLHANGIVHRDMKPQNILLEERNGALWPVLIDLGLANQTAEDASEFITSRIKGTLCWIAPEMFEGKKWSEKSDMYALGIIMWEIFTGELPHSDIRTKGALIRHVTEKDGRPEMSRLSTDVSQERQDLMKRLWHKDRKKRYTADEFLEELLRSSSGHLQGSLILDGASGNEPNVDLGFLRNWSRDVDIA